MKPETIITLFRDTHPYIQVPDNIITDAYDRVPNKETKSDPTILDLMQDYILSQGLADDVVP